MKHNYPFGHFFASNFSNFVLRYVTIIAVLFFTSSSFGQGTDACSATSITLNGACAGAATISDTTQDAPNIGTCAGTFRREGWYTFDVTGSAQDVAITGVSSSQNLFLQLIDSSDNTCTGTLSQLDCENSTGGAGASIEIISYQSLPVGTYFVKVVSVSNNDLSLTSLCVTSVADEPCNAIPLTINSSCQFATYSNEFATASTTPTPPAPGCGNYQGGDVWFSVVVPAGGTIILDTDRRIVRDSGMAIYSGTCGALTLIECDDDDSANGAMSAITRSGLTPGSTIFIRFWEYGNNNNGTFDICATEPPPCNAPTTTAATSVLTTTATINWTAASPAPASGYQYVVSTTNTPPGGAGTAAFGTSANITGLTPSTTYYVFVRSNCGSGSFSAWDGPVQFTTGGVTVPANDEPCNAEPLTVNATCTFATYTNEFATASTTPTPPAPGCGSYSGGDVWFSVVVPAGGSIIIDSDTGVMTDSGMAIYSGTCGALTLIECDDDDSANGAMSSITRSGLTPGSTIFIRFWEYGNNNNGTFDICATEPPPCNPPTTTAATAVSFTTATINWTAAAPAPATGYQYIVSPDNSTATPAGDFTGNTGAGASSANITGLAPNTTYYVFVRSNCGSGNFSSWSGPIQFTTLAVTVPPNDEPCNATPLAVNSSCTFATYTNEWATASTTPTPPAPGCGSYSGGDVWFTAVVPANGHLIVDSDTGVITDAGMAIYSGTCGSLTLIECDDDDSTNGAMSMINRPGLTPGATIYIRFWEYGNNNNGTFDICAHTPPPCTTPGSPTSMTMGAVTDSSIAGSFVAPAADGYLVLMNTTGVAPSAPVDGTVYGIGNTALGAEVIDNDGNTNFNATGLLSNTQYYFWVYSFNDTACAGPAYGTTTPTGTATTTTCTPVSTSNFEYIDDFTATGDGVLNITNNNSGAGITSTGYSDYSQPPGGPLIVTQLEGGAINFTANFEYTFSTYGFNIWIDVNDDLDFTAAELVYASGGFVNNITDSFTVPGGSAGTHVMRIRSDYSSSNPAPCGSITWGEAEDYLITITPLNCTRDPSNLVANVTTTTTATISWDPAVPAPTLGYDYIVSTSPTGTPAFASGTIPGTTVNLTGLTANTTYYVFVRGNCGPPDGQGIWITTTFNTGCADLVTTPTACPMIVGEQGTNPFTVDPFDPDPSFTVDCTSGAITLEAHSQLNETTDYIVEKIAYNPPVPYTDFSASSVNITADDVWADAFSTIGFDFCFYDNNYTQCLVGANGAVTFNSGITPGSASGYSFNNDLPSTVGALFEQTIYGVYHDVDPAPSTTDEISTRLVAGPTDAGCDKFVISWHDVPMFSNNSLLYTGMIVLHETTNIIEVFIEEKRIDGTWNNGNAIVGIQGDITPLAPNNEYAVAPCRNGTDTNWEVTNEAWRFVPSGNAINANEVNWYLGNEPVGTSATPVHTGTTYAVSAANTYTAIAEYTTCAGTVEIADVVTVTGTGKTWIGGSGVGAAQTDWMVPGNWTGNAIPLNTDCVVIPNTAFDPIISSGDHGDGLNMTVHANALLTIEANASVTIQDYVVLQGTTAQPRILIESSGSLIQVNDTPSILNSASSGHIEMRRDTNIRRSDYVYWSAPVSSWEIENISPLTPAGYKYQWTPTTAQGVGPMGAMVFGDWDPYDTGGMDVGRGYIVKGPSGHTTAPSNYTATFTGIANNGEILQPISSGGYSGAPFSYQPNVPGPFLNVTNADDNWNLIGNPYPSAIDAEVFLTNTDNSNNSTMLEGAIHIWTHNTQLAAGGTDPFYEDFLENYDPTDYITYNRSGTSTYPQTFTGKIASGQGFFVLALNDNESGSVTFNNSMRDRTHVNNLFYRSTEEAANERTESELERHRIWLELISPSIQSASMMVGYIEGATLEKDNIYDASNLEVNFMNIYSKINDDRMIIQGRPIPFDQEDQVPLGAVTPDTGEYIIAIKGVDGLFLNADQNIYLEDLYEDVIHDLRTTPYTFMVTEGETGTFDDRFILRYTNETLGLDEFDNNPGLTIKAPKSEYIKVTSTNETIDKVTVYDLLGRVLIDKSDINALELVINDIVFSDGPYIVKVTLTNGYEKIQKIVLKH